MQMNEQIAWRDICSRHPNEWVCLVDVAHEVDGTIRAGRIVGHFASAAEALGQVDSWSAGYVLAYSSRRGRRPRMLRIEMASAA